MLFSVETRSTRPPAMNGCPSIKPARCFWSVMNFNRISRPIVPLGNWSRSTDCVDSEQGILRRPKTLPAFTPCSTVPQMQPACSPCSRINFTWPTPAHTAVPKLLGLWEGRGKGDGKYQTGCHRRCFPFFDEKNRTLKIRLFHSAVRALTSVRFRQCRLANSG